MTDVILSSKVELTHCLLILLGNDDVRDLWSVVSEPDARKHIDAFREIDSETKLLSIIDVFNFAKDNGRGAMWRICETATGGFMGIIGVVDLQDVPSIFYALLPEFRHNGIMTECVVWLTKYLHENCHKSKVVTEVHEDNFASKRVLARCRYEFDEKRKIFCHYKTKT